MRQTNAISLSLAPSDPTVLWAQGESPPPLFRRRNERARLRYGGKGGKWGGKEDDGGGLTSSTGGGEGGVRVGMQQQPRRSGRVGILFSVLGRRPSVRRHRFGVGLCGLGRSPSPSARRRPPLRGLIRGARRRQRTAAAERKTEEEEEELCLPLPRFFDGPPPPPPPLLSPRRRRLSLPPSRPLTNSTLASK